ncbi:ankyrin repeat domain-containing protein 26 [Latimeria chalumnae]|uniref:ankyrin repeat domain-containing protein 26 n=1 Tax=Latimeria chalumnae TaxID=7897 RepID=UPI00313AAEB9
MKKLFGFAKKKKGFSPNTSETGSVISGGYELKEKNLGKLHKAASTGDLSKTRQLVKKHDVNQLDKENRTPLHLACANGHTDVVSFLVESNSKLNLCDNDNRSPLMKAVQCQQERCATILLEHYADPNLVDINGNTALHLAALIPTISLAAQLLEHDAHINAQNKEGCTPLFLAVTENHQEMVEFLLKEGADINATDKSKRTPLMIAASSGQISMIKLLLRYDADIAIKDDKGWTADDYAVINGHHACSHLIIEHGTKKKVPQSPPYYGTNKMKGVSMFSSPDRVPDIGFTLGGPATDREELQHSSRHNSRASDSGKVADDLSQADSGSRASDQAAGGDSWLSSDEDEELDLSLKKPPKVSLAKLMNASQQTKKNVNENINIRAQAVSLQQSKSDSEEDSHQDSEEEDVNNKSPPKPLSPTQTSLRPAIPLPGSFSKAPQMTSSPLHGFNKGESSEKNEQGNDEDGENEHRQRSSKKLNFNMSCAIQNSSQIKGSSETVKRDLMLELGLEEVDGGEESEFAWDSESVSESPKEPPVCHLSPVKTQMKKSSVPEEQNQDTFYIPSFIRRSRDYKMTKLKDSRNVGKPVGQMGTSEESRETQSKANLSPEVQKVLSPKEPSPKETVQSQNPDLMKELGLDAADDIEDASDWDSTTTSNKNIPLSLVPANHLKSDEHQSEPLASTPKGEKPYMQSIAAEPKSILLASEESNCPQNATVPPASSTPLPKPRLSHSVKENQAPPQPSTLLPAKQKNEQESGWDSEAATLPSGLGEPGKHGLGGVAPAPYNTEAAFKMFQASGDGLEYRSIDKEKQASFSLIGYDNIFLINFSLSYTCFPKDKLILETSELVENSPSNSETGKAEIFLSQHADEKVQDNESSETQTTSSDSDVGEEGPWEERYEKMWVEKEKVEVKTKFRTITAELKHKFGETCHKKKTEGSGLSEDDANKDYSNESEGELIEETIIKDDGQVEQGECSDYLHPVLQPISEQKESSLEDSVKEPASTRSPQLHHLERDDQLELEPLNDRKGDTESISNLREIDVPDKTEEIKDNSRKLTTDRKKGPIPASQRASDVGGYDTDLDSDSSGGEDKNPLVAEGQEDEEYMLSCEEEKELRKGALLSKQQILLDSCVKKSPDTLEAKFEMSSRPQLIPKLYLGEELEDDVQRFKNEVGMLKVVFLALEKEKAQLQKEVEVFLLLPSHHVVLLVTQNCIFQVEGKKKSALQEKQRCEELENIKDQRKEDSSRQVEQMTGKAIQQQMSQWPCPKGSQLKNSSRTSINTKGRPRPMQNISKRIERVSDEEDQEKNQNTCEIMKQTGFHLIASNRQTRQAMVSVNGDPLTVFDDSTLSEISQDEGRTSDKISNKKNKLNKPVDVADDFDDLTQSSDTATEDLEQPTSAFRNAMLLIEQLNTETIDSVSLLKIQTMVHEYERALEREKSRYALQSEKVAQLENERKELQGTLEETREMKSVLEHKKVEWETDINSLKFTLKQEEEKCKNAEMLYEKSREQLQKKEDQYCREVEAKQQLELTMRNLEMETRALINNMKQVEEERNEAQRLLSQERSARALQEGILNNHLRKQQEAEESKREATKCSEALAQQKEIGEREKELVQQNRTLQEEMLVFKLELDRVRARNQEEESLHLEEKEMLKEKVEDLKGELKLSEEALTQTVFQYNGQLNTLKTESAMLNSRFEHEKQSKEKLETEVESVRSRLTSALQEVERCQAAKSDAERTLQRECDEWLRLQEKRDREISSLRETIDRLSQKLSKVETKANGLENELHCATLSVTEKTLLLESSQRDLHQSQSRIKELEHSLQAEKDQLSKHVARQESMHERLAQFQSETTLLRQQLEDAQNKGIIKEKVVSDVQDRFSDIYTKLREDSEKQVRMVEERNKELNIKNNDLREQVYKYETEKTEREGALRQLQQELADALKKLSMSEASLEVTSRCRSDLEEEKLRLQKDTDKLRSKLQEMEEQCFQSERRIHELKNALDDKEREVIASSQKLQEILSASSGTDKTLKQLEDHVQRLEIENAKLEAAAKQQANRSDVLQKELQESASVRNRLEDMVTSLQAAKINLEEQLNQEVQKQTVLSQSAQGSHNLWEEELKSRSKLGLRLTQLDREKTELTGQVETEKKKVKKVAELKRSVEMRLDQEMKRNGELQKEIIKLRTLVKTAKRKLRERDSGELAAHLSSFRGELHHRHLETEGTISKLQVKVDALSQQLESELTKSTHLESTNRELREQLSSMKTLHKNHERLERSKRQLEEEVSSLKCRLEASTIEHSQIEQYKREVEERARQEIRQKLEEVNLFLQTQAASQEALEQIKATNEASLRNQLEQKIRDLESELNRVKSNQQDSITQRESAQTELERYRELYTEELKLRKSLAAKLDRSNERLAEANTKLLDERQRNKSLIASSIVNGSLTASPALDASQLGNLGSNVPVLNRGLVFGEGLLNPLGEGISSKSRVEAYLTKMQHELERNITKELDQATIELDGGSVRVSPVGSAAGSLRSLNLDQDSATRATQQYLEVLKKNYMI